MGFEECNEQQHLFVLYFSVTHDCSAVIYNLTKLVGFPVEGSD